MTWPLALAFAVTEVGWLIAAILVCWPMLRNRAAVRANPTLIVKPLALGAWLLVMFSLRTFVDPAWDHWGPVFRWGTAAGGVYALILVVTSRWWLRWIARSLERRDSAD